MKNLLDLIAISGMLLGSVLSYLILIFTATGVITAKRQTRITVFCAFAYFVLKGCTFFVPPSVRDQADSLAFCASLLTFVAGFWPLLSSLAMTLGRKENNFAPSRTEIRS